MDKETIIKGCENWVNNHKGANYLLTYSSVVELLAVLKEQKAVTGDTSDGYHTFNELYHHRAVLFSVIVANYPDRAWKAKKHHDGTMYDGMFIVGIETPDGQATYHYDIDPYWDMFKCRVLDNAPEWDGHTPAQAIERIGKLSLLKEQEAKTQGADSGMCEICSFYERAMSVKPHYNARTNWYECGACKFSMTSGMHCKGILIPAYKVGFCARCGKAVMWE